MFLIFNNCKDLTLKPTKKKKKKKKKDYTEIHLFLYI